MEDNKKTLKLRDIYSEAPEIANKEVFKSILNKAPVKNWIKENPFAGNSKYIPIGTIETLLDKFFLDKRIEILREGVSFNGVYVVVRVHVQSYLDLQWTYQDGIGAAQLQTKKNSSPAELQNINNNALQMAYPMAKSYAIKDACEHFGKFFGRDINRKDIPEFANETTGNSINKVNEDKQKERVLQGIKGCKTIDDLNTFSVLAAKYELERDFEDKQIELTQP